MVLHDGCRMCARSVEKDAHSAMHQAHRCLPAVDRGASRLLRYSTMSLTCSERRSLGRPAPSSSAGPAPAPAAAAGAAAAAPPPPVVVGAAVGGAVAAFPPVAAAAAAAEAAALPPAPALPPPAAVLPPLPPPPPIPPPVSSLSRILITRRKKSFIGFGAKLPMFRSHAKSLSWVGRLRYVPLDAHSCACGGCWVTRVSRRDRTAASHVSPPTVPRRAATQASMPSPWVCSHADAISGTKKAEKPPASGS